MEKYSRGSGNYEIQNTEDDQLGGRLWHREALRVRGRMKREEAGWYQSKLLLGAQQRNLTVERALPTWLVVKGKVCP